MKGGKEGEGRDRKEKEEGRKGGKKGEGRDRKGKEGGRKGTGRGRKGVSENLSEWWESILFKEEDLILTISTNNTFSTFINFCHASKLIQPFPTFS